jgi:hypothetical protein
MGIETRFRANLDGHKACTCGGCWVRGGKGKGYVKKLTARAVRRSAREEVKSDGE